MTPVQTALTPSTQEPNRMLTVDTSDKTLESQSGGSSSRSLLQHLQQLSASAFRSSTDLSSSLIARQTSTPPLHLESHPTQDVRVGLRHCSDSATLSPRWTTALPSPPPPPTTTTTTFAVVHRESSLRRVHHELDHGRPHFPDYTRIQPMRQPALLSFTVARFKSTLLANYVRQDGAFSGKDAVDVLCGLIATHDRNMATLLGRAIGQQGVFVHVQHMDRKLRDVDETFYRFCSIEERAALVRSSTRIRSTRSVQADVEEWIAGTSEDSVVSPPLVPDSVSSSGRVPVGETTRMSTDSHSPATVQTPAITGVFTPLTKCYSSTCKSGQGGCYSLSCPHTGLQGLPLLTVNNGEMPSELWSDAVSKQLLNSMTAQERKRQEVIHEIICTERDYVNDLLILQRLYVQPLLHSDIIDASRRDEFVRALTSSLDRVRESNAQLLNGLLKRKGENMVIDRIGDVFLQWVDHLDVYVPYCAGQVVARYMYEEECKRNSRFVQFCDSVSRRPECRRLTFPSFMNRPVTRLGRYPILLEALLRRTEPQHADVAALQEAIAAVRLALKQINVETGKADNTVRIRSLYDHLVFKGADAAEQRNSLRLLDPERRLLRSGMLRKRAGADDSELDVFLFDHLLLLCKRRREGTSVYYRVFKKVLPLYLVSVTGLNQADDLDKVADHLRDVTEGTKPTGRDGRHGSFQSAVDLIQQYQKNGYAFTMTCRAKEHISHTLYAHSHADMRQWMEAIERAAMALRESRRMFVPAPMLGGEGKSSSPPEVLRQGITCTCSFHEYIVFGTSQGVYVGSEEENFVKRIELSRVTSMDYIEELQLFIVLADQTLYYYPSKVLKEQPYSHSEKGSVNSQPNTIHGRRLGKHVSFYKIGKNFGRWFVLVVKSRRANTYIKVYEYVSIHDFLSEKSGLSKMMNLLRFPIPERFDMYKEIYVGAESKSVHFMNTKIIVGSTRGFEIIDMVTLRTQALLDAEDPILKCITDREHCTPLSIFKLDDGHFLVAYAELGLLVDADGRPIQTAYHQPTVYQWISTPHAFALEYPYVIAYSHDLIEVWHLWRHEVQQIIYVQQGYALRSASSNGVDGFICSGWTETKPLFKQKSSPDSGRILSDENEIVNETENNGLAGRLSFMDSVYVKNGDPPLLFTLKRTTSFTNDSF